MILCNAFGCIQDEPKVAMLVYIRKNDDVRDDEK
jgi:hypothetical protein